MWIDTDTINAINPADTALIQETLNKCLHQEISEVYYIRANYFDRVNELDGFHLCDAAVTLKFSNNSLLHWVWVEDGFDFKVEFLLSTSDIASLFDPKFYQSKNVSQSKDWTKLIGHEIQSVDFQVERTQGKKYLSDLRLTTNEAQVTICAVEEPNPFILPKIEHLKFATDWTIVIFDDDILRTHKRFVRGVFYP